MPVDEQIPQQPTTSVKRQGFLRQFMRLAGPYWAGPDKWRVRGMLGLLVALTLLQVVSPILINLWSANLFNALEQRSMDRFLVQIGALVIILVFAMAVTAVHLVIKRRVQVGWRDWLTRRLLDDWLADGRHYQVTHIPGEHDNPDGRIAEDVRNATEAAIDLAHSLVYCVLLLVSFTQILWTLSGVIQVPLFGTEFDVPGHMVFVSLFYASAGTTAAVLIGRPLVGAVNLRQTKEANFRFGLVRVRESSESIALLDGEPEEQRRLAEMFKGVVHAFDIQTNALARVFLFSSGYAVLATGFPILITAPRYIAGAITLGALMQIAQAFQQMTSALSWPVDNLSKAAEWKASVERVMALHNAIETLKGDIACMPDSRICVGPSDKPVLAFRDLTIANADGTTVVSRFEAEIQQGERVLISGDPGGALKLFKVVAGLWPWGRGHIELPGDGAISFVPERPYLPIGSLRSTLRYPSDRDVFAEATVLKAMQKVGLGHLTHRLMDVGNWEQVLTLGEQQRIGFARLLLHRPDWIFLDEATDCLEEKAEQELMSLLIAELPNATILTVGYNQGLEQFHHRKLVLEASGHGPAFIRETSLVRTSERRRKMGALDLRHWLIHPLRRATEKPKNGSRD
ncbi:ABC transporter [Magnetospirillum moscoviense]|uniref:ABC transporter n=2 Tax=Magnetospirillum moscoviense TaxID=1437059 RepID=A0A178M726_9PROT|nr:ABC transporter [Magnetospirillum moscoviense]